MSGFQLIASLASSLAWPVLAFVALMVVWRNRAQLFEAMNFSWARREGRSVKRLKAGPIELEWDAVVESIVEEVPEATDRGHDAPDATLDEELSSVIDLAPAAAVMEAFARIERRLIELVSDKVDRPINRVTLGYAAKVAFESGLIPEVLYGAIASLRNLRNEAAHRVGNAEITRDQAQKYVYLAANVLASLDDL